MLVIGLTGGIGSGKSTVARYFAQLGVPVIDADAVARDLVAPGGDTFHEIVAQFGADVLRPDGALDRARLRERVFQHPAERRALEDILHPRIYEEMRRQIMLLRAPYCVAVIPLLLETGRRDFVDRVLVVDASETLQRTRAQHRDGASAEEVDAVMRAQVNRETRRRAANDIISNEEDFEALKRETEVLHRRYLAMASAEGGV